MMKVFTINISKISEEDWLFYEQIKHSLPSVCIKKMDRNLCLKSRRLSLAAWLLLFCYLQREEILNMDITYGYFGKPYLATNRIYFNLSHSYPWAGVIISDKEVGMDIETKLIKDPYMVIETLKEEEKKWVVSQGEENIKDRFRSFWSIKEAWLKFLGCGLSGAGKELSFISDFRTNCINKINVDGKEMVFIQQKIDENTVLTGCGFSSNYTEVEISNKNLKRSLCEEKNGSIYLLQKV